MSLKQQQLSLELTLQYSPLYGYDCVVFSDGIQFIMENCQNKFNQQIIKHQMIHRNLEKSLQTLHLLHICHCDIKPDNIAWSQEQNKMIFLDFGFSQFVMENRNQQTRTKFKGSFDYCCPAMRKNYTLSSASPVNLYENDKYGLQKVMEKFKNFQDQSQLGKEMFHEDGLFSRANSTKQEDQLFQKNTDYSYGTIEKQGFNFSVYAYDIIWFFKFKFCLFLELESQLQQILKENKNQQLTMIFGRILLEEWENTETKKIDRRKKLFFLYQHYSKGQQCKQQSQQTKKVSEYVEQKQNQNTSEYVEATVLLFSQESTQLKLNKHWGNWEWMKALFNFLLPVNMKNFPKRQRRFKIVSDLYCIFQPDSCSALQKERNPYKEYHFILVKFLQYFVTLLKNKQTNFEKIGLIIAILKASFIILGDYKKNQEIQKIMIEFILDPIVKTQKIFQFFLQKFLLSKSQIGGLSFGLNYKEQIMKIEQINEKQHQYLKTLKQKYITKINYLQSIIYVSDDECKQSFLLRENRIFYKKILQQRSSGEGKDKKILQQLFQCLGDVTPSQQSENFWIHAVKGKINDFFEGTTEKETILLKAPLYNVFWFMTYHLGMQVPELYFERLVELEMSLENPQFFSLTQKKTLKWALYISAKQFYTFLINYFQYFTPEILNSIQDSLKIRRLKETVLGTIETVLMLLIQNNFEQNQKDLKAALIDKLTNLSENFFKKDPKFQLLFQGSIYRLNRETQRAFNKFQQGFQNSSNISDKSYFLYNIVELRTDLTGHQLEEFFKIILSYREQHPQNTPSVIMELLKLSTVTVEAFCFQKDICSAFQCMKNDFIKLKRLGRICLQQSMFKQLQYFSVLAPKQQVVQILQHKLFQQTLQQICLTNSFEFYFGLFHAVFSKIQNLLSIKAIKRFLIISIFENSRFEYNYNSIGEAYLRMKILKYFPIISSRKNEIQSKRLSLLRRNLSRWQKSFSNKKWIENINNKFKLKIGDMKRLLKEY